MDLKETAGKRRNVENLKRKRKEEKKRILLFVAPFFFPWLYRFSVVLSSKLGLGTEVFLSRFARPTEEAEEKTKRRN